MERRLEDAFAHVAALERLEGRLLRRVLQREQPFAFQATFMCRGRRCREIRFAEPVELLDIVEDERRGTRRRKHAVLEFRRQSGLFLIQRAKRLLRWFVELRTGTHEIEMIPLDKPSLLGRERDLFSRREDRVDPREDACVKVNGIGVRGESRRDLDLQVLQRVVGIRSGDRVKGTQRTGQQVAAALERLERVLERGDRVLRRDGLDLGELLAHAELDCRQEMVVANFVEGRCAERQTAGREQRIVIRGSGCVDHRRDESGGRGAFTSLFPPTSPGSDGRKLRSQANQSVRENGKNAIGRSTARMRPTISISVHG